MTWPEIPAGWLARSEYQAKIFQAKVDIAREETLEELRLGMELQRLTWESEHKLNKVIHDARVEVARTSVDRAHKAADSIRLVAAAIGTVYTGIAGLSYAASEQTFPAIGIVPALFLGISLVMSTAYLAWLGNLKSTEAPEPDSRLPQHQELRLNAYINWASTLVSHRVYTLKVAILSLGAAVAFLPVPFLRIAGNYTVCTWVIVGIVLTAILVIPLILRKRSSN